MATTIEQPQQQQKKALVEVLEERFPDPQPMPPTPGEDDGEGYCVGGALFMHLADLSPEDADCHTRFPGKSALGTVLEEVNSRLPGCYADRCAIKAIQHNDNGDFMKAYQWIDDAMLYPDG